MIHLATCSYIEYTPGMGHPIRTSRGTPKYFRHSLPLAWTNVMPDYWMLKIDDADEYKTAYLQKLERFGHHRLMDDIVHMASTFNNITGTTGKPLVMLCYEKLSTPGNWCHRTMLADWLSAKLEQPIPELGAACKHAPTTPAPPTLF